MRNITACNEDTENNGMKPQPGVMKLLSHLLILEPVAAFN